MIVALSAENREKVDQMINKVIEAGGRESREPQNYGCMDAVFKILMDTFGK